MSDLIMYSRQIVEPMSIFAVKRTREALKRSTGAVSDELLVREFKEHPDRSPRRDQAFDTLVLRHQDMVFSLCLRVIGDYDEANDCAQDVFIKVYRGLDGFKMEANFTTWLYRIAVNTCRNRIASAQYRARARGVRLNDEDDPADKSRSREIIDTTYAPDSLYQRGEDERAIQSAINALPEAQRLLVVLRDIEGKTYQEIAEITGLKEGTVKSKLARARERMRESLREVFDDL